MAEEKCRNMNHGRMNIPVRHCTDCGEILNDRAGATCDEEIHARRRKEQKNFCCDCGQILRRLYGQG